MFHTTCIFVCSLIFLSVKGQEPCPKSYPANCECFAKLKIVKCDNMTTTTEFPRGVFKNDTKWLSIKKSNIKNLTKDDFVGLPALVYLRMSQGNLSYIQEGTFQQLLNLTIVALYDNKLVSIPPGVFANISKLNEVRLGKNPFEVLPDGMFENSWLRTLFLRYSKLNSTALDAIGSGRVSKTITKLYLGFSNFPRLARGQFSGLPSLVTIGLKHCNIQYVHTDFLNGTRVSYVNLRGNSIVKIDSDAMRGGQINTFICNYCGLTTDKVFGNDSFLLQMTSLRRLDLGFNEITHVPKDAFKGLSNITLLGLYYNNISAIEENPFTAFTDLKYFEIQKNPFKCDCHLGWFHEFSLSHFKTQHRGDQLLKNMTCASPTNLADKKFSDLETSQFCCTAINSPGPVCDVDSNRTTVRPDSKGTTVRPTSGTLSMQPALLVLLFLSLFNNSHVVI